jgi:flagellar motor switch/type III secretory pathway protein FliN
MIGVGVALPFGLSSVDRGKARLREKIVNRFPGDVEGIRLDGLADVLGLKGVRLKLAGICDAPSALPSDCVPVAIASRGDRRSNRLVLGLSANLADRIVNLTLGRDGRPDTAVAFMDERLLSGEKGALLFGIDAAGGDWVHAGGGNFIVKALLFDGDQIPDYLRARPTFEVTGRLVGPGIDGFLWLWGIDPVPAASSGDSEPCVLLQLWRTALKVQVGYAIVSYDDLTNLCEGDRILLDGWCHPMGTGGEGGPILRSGRWHRFGRWLDNRRFEVINSGERIKELVRSDEQNNMSVILDTSERGDDGEITVTIDVEVGSFKSTVQQAAKILPGRIISLDREVSNSVMLKVDGKLIGRGILVDHEGIMAVEVKEMVS